MNKNREHDEDPPQKIRRDIWTDLNSGNYKLDDIDNNKNSDLMMACYLQDIKLVRHLLDLGANPNLVNCAGENAAHLVVFSCIEHSHHIGLELLTMLCESHIDLNVIALDNCTPLALSCCYDMPSISQKLIKLNADTHLTKENNSPLALACYNKQIQAVYCLCASVEKQNDIDLFYQDIITCPEDLPSKQYANQLLQSLSIEKKLQNELPHKIFKNSTKI